MKVDLNSDSKILILGAHGQVGSALFSMLGTRCIGISRADLDLSNSDNLKQLLKNLPDLQAVYNAAAYTQVDRAESEQELCIALNEKVPKILAGFCIQRNIPLVHFSTDYVFDGSGERPWVETDPTQPLNIYGKSKLAGEKAILLSGARFLIFRTSWVYDSKGKNFFRTMLKLGNEQESLNVVSDQYGAPTYAPELAGSAIVGLKNALLMEQFPTGVFHLCNSGETTWFGFAEAIFERARRLGLPLKINSLTPISTQQYLTPAKRPLNSRLNCNRAKSVLGLSMRPWAESLDHILERYHENY